MPMGIALKVSWLRSPLGENALGTKMSATWRHFNGDRPFTHTAFRRSALYFVRDIVVERRHGRLYRRVVKSRTGRPAITGKAATVHVLRKQRQRLPRHDSGIFSGKYYPRVV